MKIAMIGIISNPPESLKSHNGGWTLVCKNILKKHFNVDTINIENNPLKFNDYDILVINEGVNYRENQYNFFGGVQELTINKIKSLYNFKGKLYIINEKLDFNDLFKKRKELNQFINIKMPIINVIKTINDFDKKIIIGDSHSISIYKPGYGIMRNDGKTLYSFLRDHKDDSFYTKREEVIVYFGNIDIRFHLPRQQDPIKATIDLANRYVNWCFKTRSKPVCLLPIEDENREIPNTGKYKNQNFFGSRKLRRLLVKEFNYILQSHFLDCYVWPDKWYLEDYNFINEMELRKSVHLRPTSYMNYSKLLDTKNQELTLF